MLLLVAHTCRMNRQSNDETAKNALAKLPVPQLAHLRELHQRGATSELHEQLKLLLGMKKMGERARAIGVLLRMPEGTGTGGGSSDEDNELVLEGNEMDVAKSRDGDGELVIAPNGVTEPKQRTPQPSPACQPAEPRPASSSSSSASSPPSYEVHVERDLRPLPYLLNEGPQTPMEVLGTHEHYRKRAAGFEHAQMRLHMFTTLLIQVCSGRRAPPTAATSTSGAASEPAHAAGADAPSNPVPKLALLVASHVRDAARLAKLRSCLLSIAAQRGGAPTAVWLSWSANDDVRGDVRRMVTDTGDAMPHMRALEQPGALRQFEHYAALTARATQELSGDAWACFSDDDDLLHPDRSRAYREAIRVAPAGARAVGAMWTARPVAIEHASTADDVDALIRQGRVVQTPKRDPRSGRQTEDHDGGHVSSWDEYFNYAVQLSTLAEFFATSCPELVRRSMYADMVLHKYLMNAVPTARFQPSSHGFTTNWGYYYDKPLDVEQAAKQGNASSGATLDEADVATAGVLRQLIPGLQAYGEKELIRLAAQERSLAEIYCTSFAGCSPIPLTIFINLGKLVLFDHYEGLGFDPVVANDLTKRATRLLARTAAAFCVRTDPQITHNAGGARPPGPAA